MYFNTWTFLITDNTALWIAKDAKTFWELLVVGVVSMLGFQAFVNIGVVTALLPNTGLPLPFIVQEEVLYGLI